ncbi:hypothetical protein [Chryseobacterium sp. M5A1_1a]
MQEDKGKEFLPLVSKPWFFMTWLTRIFAVVLLLAFLLGILILPAMICQNLTVFIVVAIPYYPGLIYLLYRFFRYQKKIRKREVRKIVVDDKGVHYERTDGTVDEILYKNLKKYSFSDGYDVNISPRNKQYMLNVNNRGDTVDVDFDGMDAGYSYYITNLRALRRRYIHGIAHFRPDLSINPRVYSVYYIHPVDFTFDRKDYWTTILKVTGVLAVLCLGSGFLLYKLGKIIFLK